MIPSPQKVALPSQAFDVAVGSTFACAALGSAGVMCWGGDVFGALGDGVVDYGTPSGVNLPYP